jgi:hypothetical protein
MAKIHATRHTSAARAADAGIAHHLALVIALAIAAAAVAAAAT